MTPGSGVCQRLPLFTIGEAGETLHLNLDPERDFSYISVDWTNEAVQRLGAVHRMVVVDMSGLQQLPSAFYAGLLQLAAAAGERQIELRRVSLRVLRYLELLRIAERFVVQMEREARHAPRRPVVQSGDWPMPELRP